MVDLKDSTGEQIVSSTGYWYKIQLADGTEIGLGEVYASGPVSTKDGRTLIKVVPAGQGMVFRYQRSDGGNSGNYGWPIGDVGYLRGIQVKDDGSETILNMSLSWEPVKLCMYNNNENYGMIANQLPGNRVALYGRNRHGTICGLRVTSDNHVIAHESSHALALDCTFVRVGSFRFSDMF